MDILINTWELFLESAPWLLFGLLVAGLIKAWMPDDLMARWLGKRGSGSVVRAALFGMPLPLCSCGVLPAALGLRRSGASKGATVSFLISTPESGVDSIAISYALLGPFMAIVRPVAAVISAIVAGLMVNVVDDEEEKEQSTLSKTPTSSTPVQMAVAAPVPMPSVGGKMIPIASPGGGGTIPIAASGGVMPRVAAESDESCGDSCACDTGSTVKPAATTIPISGTIPVAIPVAAPQKSTTESCCSSESVAAVAAPVAGGSCCSSEPVVSVAAPVEGGSCCSSTTDADAGGESDCCSSGGDAETPAKKGWLARTVWGLKYALTNILDDLVLWLGVGLLAAGVVATFVPPQTLAEWGQGWTAMLVMILIGIPMYICATASTPLAAALLFAGVSPGATLVFLLVGPATNVGALTVVKRELGLKALIAYLVGIIGVGVLFGVGTDIAAVAMGWDFASEVAG
ncbi:MAG: SO_0444 family Cu/Zn efflux transporter, partial [Magnetococcales bacterium]|nr:SO_0444 family Cu/Zn efflux transporter [Magnetococcales bacterium]